MSVREAVVVLDSINVCEKEGWNRDDKSKFWKRVRVVTRVPGRVSIGNIVVQHSVRPTNL